MNGKFKVTLTALGSVFLLATVMLAAQDAPVPAPLNTRQIERVRGLVETTQSEVTQLQTRLAERQRDLDRVYTQYRLDEPAARKLQEEIVELQRRLLASHHQMHVGLRSIVDQKQYERLRGRLEQILHSGTAIGIKEPSKTTRSPSPKP